jgi:plastocyanin
MPATRTATLIFSTIAVTTSLASPAGSAHQASNPYYLPDAAASRVVTVVPRSGAAEAGLTIITQAVAERDDESGARSCQIYAFTPSFIAVHRDEPTLISFRNFQADDDHDFMLVGASSKVLMFVTLPALKETSYVFTFHKEGLFSFHCTMHQPEMNGQILVLPPVQSPRVESGAAAPTALPAMPSMQSVTGAAASLASAKTANLADCRIWGVQLEAERMWTDFRGHKWDAVERLISPAFQSVRGDRVRNRAAELALLQQQDFKGRTPHAFKVTYSGDTAMVTYRILSYVKTPVGKLREINVMALSVWRRTNAGWQWIAHSETDGSP